MCPRRDGRAARSACCAPARSPPAPDYGVERLSHSGQDILYCLSGAGVVETLGQRLEVQPGQLVWIANEQPHAHIADPRAPWTVLWFRLDGPNPAALRKKLFGDGAPRVVMIEGASLAAWFDRLFVAMRRRGLGVDLRLNQLVGRIPDDRRSGAGGVSDARRARRARRGDDGDAHRLQPAVERRRSLRDHGPQPIADRGGCFAGICAPARANGCCANG